MINKPADGCKPDRVLCDGFFTSGSQFKQIRLLSDKIVSR